MGYVAVNLLLDTHIWLWWINQNGPLTNQHRETIAQAEQVFISSISCWELVMLYQRQRIELDLPLQDWLSIALRDIVCLPLTAEIAMRAALLDFQHRDPADRFIIATALLADCQIMSFDGQFKFYAELDNRLIGNH
jgi:PIN domain nuclease of toxin-antitoxin system